MDHLLLMEDHRDLRKQVISHITQSYRVKRNSNLVFVCGGNDLTQMRPRFKAFCALNLPEFEVFQPEFAMKNLFSSQQTAPFDIADFESLIGELSHAIVIFPEAPGSYAETGYFSAVPTLANKSILVNNIVYQNSDSFISLGPAKKISEASIYHPNIQSDYLNPKFDDIIDRIRRYPAPQTRKHLKLEKFKDASAYDLSCLIYCISKILTVSTFDDTLYIFRSMFKNHLSVNKVQQLYSTLVGAGYLVPIGGYGHFRVAKSKANLAEIMEGRAGVLNTIRLQLAALYESGEQEFVALLEEANNAS